MAHEGNEKFSGVAFCAVPHRYIRKHCTANVCLRSPASNGNRDSSGADVEGTGGSVDVLPAYTLLLGTTSQMSTPVESDMIPSAVAVRESWASTMCPLHMVLPSWGRGHDSRGLHLHQRSVGNGTDWGHIKIKKVDPNRWIPHVHQTLFWCGHAEQGKGAWSRMMRERSSKGKAA